MDSKNEVTLELGPYGGTSARRGVDLRFVGRSIAGCALFVAAMIPPLLMWPVMPAFAVLLGGPVLLAAAIDRRAFPVWAFQSLAFIVFAVARIYADDTGIAWRSDYVIVADAVFALGRNPSAALQAALMHPALDAFASWTYVSFFIVPSLVGLALWWSRRGLARYFVAIAAVDAISLIFIYAVPTVPPWLASMNGSIEPIRRIFVETMGGSMPDMVDAGYRASANDVAAMPSVHMALTVIAALGLARFGRAATYAGIAYALIMLFSIVYLGEHYLVDGLAGVVVAFAGWRAAGPLAGRLFALSKLEAAPRIIRGPDADPWWRRA